MKKYIYSGVIAATFAGMSLISATAHASQYLGFGIDYGVLTEQESDAEYPIFNFEGRFGLDFTDRFTIEVEGATLGKKEREFSGQCLDQEAVDQLTFGDDDVAIGCAYLDSVSRQTVSVNFIFSQPFPRFELFAGLGIGAARTSYTFDVDNVGISTLDDFRDFSASDVQTIQGYLDLLLGDGVFDLQLPDNISETSIDMMYSLEAGVLVDDTHRLAVTWNPEYGSDEVGKYEYLSVSYSWLFRLD
ncbi:hypothetical protein [Thalassolituus maritimus]|uniref:Outer membrane protein beta-barrel domain-containing protein n=1 Tax=Thalassolituus maritimus TaxID=484498 RepID=A0ABP9ZXY4_9GAMM